MPATLFAQVQNATASIDPPTFDENTEITITISGIDPAAWGVTDVYFWTWYNLESDTNNSNDIGVDSNGAWTNSDESHKMTDNGDGSFSYTLTPATFYGATGIGNIGFLAKAKDGTGDKKTQDFEFKVGGYQLTLTNPTSPTIQVTAGETATIEAVTSENSTFTLTANGTQVDTQSGTDTYTYITTINETTNFTLEATNGTETLSESFTYIIPPNVVEEALPTGLVNGINYDPADNTRATLVLFAPGKSFAHVIGSFNNWEINDDYLMKKVPGEDTFWLELTGLTPGENYSFQYLVDLSINVADPYSTTILDPFNDQFIDETTYPGLPAYPEATTEAVTLLRTGDAPYNWSAATTGFTPPAKTDLVIYELLIRDFDELHSFAAVEARLDYLETLGINAIELMPVNEFDGNESWGYNPAFHMALDKYYGTPEAFKQFIDACHARGMAVIIDVVYNHATGQHPYVRLWNQTNGTPSGAPSEENPFFNTQATHSYSVFNDFDHSSEFTRDYVNRTLEYWIEEYKVDGFRWDLTKGFTQNCSDADQGCTNSTQADRIAYLKEYADTQWAVDDDFYVIFEHLGGLQEEEQWADYRAEEGKGIMLWNKMTGPYNEATMGYNATSDFSGVSWKAKGFKQPSAVSYMESHDEERLMFKNLQFGNGEGGYNVTDLNTALSRMPAAGAVFFTVPGPKMIWQFGELGYDISIDENGRTGNKPILWQYFDVAERKAIYDSWSDLIKLRTGEPIFETTDFTMDVGNGSAIKKIDLYDPNAGEGAISHVTVIANFALSEVTTTVDFSAIGPWYEVLKENKKYVVASLDQTITLAPGEFRLFANNPSALFPDNNIPDQDHDGVADTEDLCPDTPLGATVDLTGCEIFTLPADNFSLASKGESCPDSNDGSIAVTTLETHNYEVTVTGTAYTFSDAFNGTSWNVGDLEAGRYQVCFTVAGEDDFEQCFEVELGAPEPLSVYSKVNTAARSMNLDLSGSDRYLITLNGFTYETSEATYKLPLKEGWNEVSVKTATPCQGEYKERIFIGETAMAYPNPARDHVSVALPSGTQANYSLYDLQGRLVTQGSLNGNTSATARIDVTQLVPGTYLLQLKGEGLSKTLKIMKK
ncbi:alpha-amylase family glycosyl hydrolase [Robertkochia sediminum]|uniref:alpha-amylase family glycosyl hydrolase n=1 Tax=Robertkochia sediminum TaxID=2785326 RepID=UPI001EEA79AA|nr:alpha-amylase family glycosyl hydrolase [Robertkochia sediminum]